MDHRLQIILGAKDISGAALTKFKGKIGSITKSVFSLRTAIGTLTGAGGIGYLVKSSLNAADAIGKAADVAGVHTRVLQEYQHAADLSGVSTQLLNQSFLAFNKRLGEARANTGPLVSYLKKVDEQFLNQIKNASDTEAALNLVFKRMGRLTEAADRAALANAAFSRSGVKLVVMAKNGAAGLDAMRAEAHRLGLVIKDNLIREAEVANDKLNTLGRVLKTRITATVVELAPEIVKVADNTLKWVENNQKLINQDVPKYLGAIATNIKTFTENMATAVAKSKALYDIFKKLMGTGLWELAPPAPEVWEGSHGYSGSDYKSKGKAATTLPPPAAAAGIAVPAGRFAPRADRGPWAPRGGGMVGVVEAEKKQLAEIETATVEAYDKMDSHVTAYYDNVAAQAQKTADGVDYMADKMAGSIADFASTGKLNFADFADSVMHDMIRIQARSLLTGVFSKIAGDSGGLFAAFAEAKGGVYDPSGRTRFAAGGIVNRPTVFPFAGGMGLMGEAGPEAIMPLTRTAGGQLGVKAAGGGGDVQVIINNQSGTRATVKRQTDSDGIRRLIVDIAAADIMGGGRLAKANEMVYSLSRRGRTV